MTSDVHEFTFNQVVVILVWHKFIGSYLSNATGLLVYCDSAEFRLAFNLFVNLIQLVC